MYTVKTNSCLLAFAFYCGQVTNPITRCLIHWANPTGTFLALQDTTQYWRTTCQNNDVKDHILWFTLESVCQMIFRMALHEMLQNSL